MQLPDILFVGFTATLAFLAISSTSLVPLCTALRSLSPDSIGASYQKRWASVGLTSLAMVASVFMGMAAAYMTVFVASALMRHLHRSYGTSICRRQLQEELDHWLTRAEEGRQSKAGQPHSPQEAPAKPSPHGAVVQEAPDDQGADDITAGALVDQ